MLYVYDRQLKIEQKTYEKLGPRFVAYIDNAYKAAIKAYRAAKNRNQQLPIENPCQNLFKWHRFCNNFANMTPSAALYVAPWLNNIDNILSRPILTFYAGVLDKESDFKNFQAIFFGLLLN